MDRNLLLNDTGAATLMALDGRQKRIWTAMPAIIQSIDFESMTCEAVPAIQGLQTNPDGSTTYVNLPKLVDVPICFPSAGGFTLTLPMVAGDEILIIIASRAIDSWWQNGGFGVPVELRMHDLSDGFAIPGPRSIPNVVSSISTTSAQLRNDAGDQVFGLNPDGTFSLENGTTNLKAVLTDLQSALNAFMATLAAFSGGSSPVTQTMLQAPAATAVTALTAVLTEIGELLT